MIRLFNLSHIAAGFSTVLVGYASAVIIVIQGAIAIGATEEQVESWLFALGIAMGITCIGFSWFYKKPVLTAWSTPGAVILASGAAQYGIEEAIGAFVISGGLIILTGLIRPLSQALENIPSSLGAAMLCAILLPFCVSAFAPVQSHPIIFVVMLLGFIITQRYMPKYTMLVLLLIGAISAPLLLGHDLSLSLFSMTKPVWVTPTFQLENMLNLAVPLYLVTMLSQNLPGIAMMRNHGYKVPVRSLFIGTGVTNVMLAPLGAFSVNLAAITAAICMQPSVDADPNKRYRAAIWAGVFYLFAGIFASTVVAFFTAFPKVIIQILTGFALFGTLLICLENAFKDVKTRDSALFTFLMTLSGSVLFGLSATLLGLLIGLGHLGFKRATSRSSN
jgi:benzoate membrane transport protein